MENPQILRILSKDDLHLEELGIGVNVGDNSVTADQIMALQKSRKEVRSFFDKNFTKGVFREKVLRIISTLNLWWVHSAWADYCNHITVFSGWNWYFVAWESVASWKNDVTDFSYNAQIAVTCI